VNEEVASSYWKLEVRQYKHGWKHSDSRVQQLGYSIWKASYIHVHIGNALNCNITILWSFGGLIIDLFSRGVVMIPVLQWIETWNHVLRGCLPGGKIFHILTLDDAVAWTIGCFKPSHHVQASLLDTSWSLMELECFCRSHYGQLRKLMCKGSWGAGCARDDGP
jgi:hypothetical protein